MQKHRKHPSSSPAEEATRVPHGIPGCFRSPHRLCLAISWRSNAARVPALHQGASQPSRDSGLCAPIRSADFRDGACCILSVSTLMLVMAKSLLQLRNDGLVRANCRQLQARPAPRARNSLITQSPLMLPRLSCIPNNSPTRRKVNRRHRKRLRCRLEISRKHMLQLEPIVSGDNGPPKRTPVVPLLA